MGAFCVLRSSFGPFGGHIWQYSGFTPGGLYLRSLLAVLGWRGFFRGTQRPRCRAVAPATLTWRLRASHMWAELVQSPDHTHLVLCVLDLADEGHHKVSGFLSQSKRSTASRMTTISSRCSKWRPNLTMYPNKMRGLSLPPDTLRGSPGTPKYCQFQQYCRFP